MLLSALTNQPNLTLKFCHLIKWKDKKKKEVQ